MTPGGGVLSKPKTENAPSSIEFGPQRIVLRYVPLSSLQLITDTAYTLIRSISEDIEVSSFDRLGLRAKYFIPSTNFREVSRSFLTKIVTSTLSSLPEPGPDSSTSFEVRVPFKSNEFEVVLRLRAVRIVRPAEGPQDYPTDGLELDVDVFKKENFRRRDSSSFIMTAAARAEALVGEIGIPLLEEVEL